jgi:hypothetical protein
VSFGDSTVEQESFIPARCSAAELEHLGAAGIGLILRRFTSGLWRA